MWNDNTFLAARSCTNLMKISCLLWVDFARKHNNLTNKTKNMYRLRSLHRRGLFVARSAISTLHFLASSRHPTQVYICVSVRLRAAFNKSDYLSLLLYIILTAANLLFMNCPCHWGVHPDHKLLSLCDKAIFRWEMYSEVDRRPYGWGGGL